MDNGEVFAIDVLNWATRYVGRNILLRYYHDDIQVLPLLPPMPAC